MGSLIDIAGNLMPTYQNDYTYGVSHQKDVVKSLEGFFGENIEETKDRYCIYDAESKQTNYEIKSRRFHKDKYPTTIIPSHKTKANKARRLIFVFRFTDGLYYIEYIPALFNSFEKKMVTYQRQGIQVRPVEHYCIPIELLTEIHI